MDLDTEDFWKLFYASHADLGREWYVERPVALFWSARLLAPLLLRRAGSSPPRCRVLHVGAGTSTLHLSIAAAARGARERVAAQTSDAIVARLTVANIDFAAESVAALERHSALAWPTITTEEEDDAFEYVAGDVRDLVDLFAPSSFAAAIDKGTLDSLLSAGARSNAHAALFELSHALQPQGGRLIVFSLFGPGERLAVLLDGEEAAWTECAAAAAVAREAEGGDGELAAEEAAARAIAAAADDASSVAFEALGFATVGRSRRYGWRVWWRALNIAPLEVGFSDGTWVYVCVKEDEVAAAAVAAAAVAAAGVAVSNVSSDDDSVSAEGCGRPVE
jgi:hypothetical protein